MAKFDVASSIIEYESGTISPRGALKLFSHLIKSGMAWQLQGAYGRAASHLIENGFVTREGDITEKAKAVLQQ